MLGQVRVAERAAGPLCAIVGRGGWRHRLVEFDRQLQVRALQDGAEHGAAVAARAQRVRAGDEGGAGGDDGLRVGGRCDRRAGVEHAWRLDQVDGRRLRPVVRGLEPVLDLGGLRALGGGGEQARLDQTLVQLARFAQQRLRVSALTGEQHAV